MAGINKASAGSVQGAVKQTVDLKKKGLKQRVGFSLQKKNAVVHIKANKQLLQSHTTSKGSKVNIFA